MKPLKVIQIPGEATRFRVQGKSVNWYLVDLGEYNGNGSCGCQHFEFRLKPTLERNHEIDWTRTPMRCRHIEAARQFALDVILKSYGRQQMVNANGQKERDAA
jgi:hypothetical protein